MRRGENQTNRLIDAVVQLCPWDGDLRRGTWGTRPCLAGLDCGSPRSSAVPEYCLCTADRRRCFARILG